MAEDDGILTTEKLKDVYNHVYRKKRQYDNNITDFTIPPTYQKYFLGVGQLNNEFLNKTYQMLDSKKQSEDIQKKYEEDKKKIAEEKRLQKQKFEEEIKQTKERANEYINNL